MWNMVQPLSGKYSGQQPPFDSSKKPFHRTTLCSLYLINIPATPNSIKDVWCTFKWARGWQCDFMIYWWDEIRNEEDVLLFMCSFHPFWDYLVMIKQISNLEAFVTEIISSEPFKIINQRYASKLEWIGWLVFSREYKPNMD